GGVEQHAEARLAADAKMVAAMPAHLEMRRQLAMKQHLLAGRALLPQIVRHVLLGEGADLRQHVIGQPVHRLGSGAAGMRSVREKSLPLKSTASPVAFASA